MMINYQDICKNIFSEKEFIENSLLGIGVLQDDRIIYVNNTILKLFGYSFDEIQEKDFWMRVIHPDDLSKVRKQIESKLKEKKNNTTRYKCRILLRSGEFKWVEVFSKIFYDEDHTRSAKLCSRLSLRRAHKSGSRALQGPCRQRRGLGTRQFSCSTSYRVELLAMVYQNLDF